MNLYILIGVIIVSPIWGMVSSQLFLQSWLAFINSGILIIGIVRGVVPRKDNLLGLGIATFQGILFSILLSLGHYLLTRILSFGYTKTENIVYWIFASISLLYMIPQISPKIRKTWRNANIPGSLEEDIIKRKLQTPATGREFTIGQALEMLKDLDRMIEKAPEEGKHYLIELKADLQKIVEGAVTVADAELILKDAKGKIK